MARVAHTCLIIQHPNSPVILMDPKTFFDAREQPVRSKCAAPMDSVMAALEARDKEREQALRECKDEESRERLRACFDDDVVF